MIPPKVAYSAALAILVGACLFLAFAVGALGLIGAEGDPFDRVYFGVILTAVVTAALARFRAEGMMHAAIAPALFLGMIAAVALAQGRHLHPATSVAELLGLHAMFAALFLAAAWLFRAAIRPSEGRKPRPRTS